MDAPKVAPKCDLKAKWQDFDWTVEWIAETLAMVPDEPTAAGKSPTTVKTRAFLCFWRHRTLVMTLVDIAANLSIGWGESLTLEG